MKRKKRKERGSRDKWERKKRESRNAYAQKLKKPGSIHKGKHGSQ